MNSRTIFKLGALLLTLLFVVAGTAFAQTVYVDVTNGSDTYTGANEINNPAGTGPKATINGGLAALANGGTLSIKAGTYNGGNGAGGNVDINTTTYTAFVAGSSITIQVAPLLSNNEVQLSAGSFIYNVSGGTLNIVSSDGNAYFNIAAGATGNLTLGSSTNNSTMNIALAASFRIASLGTITMNGTSAFSNAAPQKGTNLNLTYGGGSSPTGGPESNYGTYGTGVLTVNKTAGTTVTLSNAMTLGGVTGTSGNATFAGAITMGANDITNNGTGTLTFSSTVGFSITNGTADANLGSVENTSTGSIVFDGAATWTAGTFTGANVFAAAGGTYIVDNQSTGSIAFNQPITLVNSQATATWDATVTARNGAAGALTLGSLTAATGGTGATVVILNVTNAASAGTMTLAGGTIRGTLTNVTGATTTVNGTLSVAGVFTNAGTVALGANVLTLSGSAAHLTNGGTVTASGSGGIAVTSTGTPSFDGGTLSNVTLSGSGTTTFQTNAITASNLNVSAGTLTVSIATTISTGGAFNLTGGTVNVGNVVFTTRGYTQSGGTFTLAANAASTLDVKGDFNRTGGTFTAGAASKTTFTSTTGAQNFNGGPLIQVSDLTFTNTSGTITLGQSVRATGAVSISANTSLALSTFNIILFANSASITNAGSYTATGGGGVIFGGVNTVSGSAAAYTGQTIAGTGVYSYITIDVGTAAANKVVMSAANHVKFNGVLRFTSGDLEINNGSGSFGPTGTAASIIRNINATTGSALGIFVTAGGFNTNVAVDYDLEYTGAFAADVTVTVNSTTSGAELTSGNVRDLTMTATSAANKLILAHTAAITIKRNLTLAAPATNATVMDLPAQNLTVKGALFVGQGATLAAGNAANPITLDGDAQSHTVAGTITAAGVLTVTGNGSTLTGSTVTAAAATVNSLSFEPAAASAAFTSTNLKVISGNLTIQGTSILTGATATVTMNATSSTLTGNLTVGNATVGPTASVTIAGTTTSVHGGNLVLTNGSLTLTRGTTTALSTTNGTATLTAGTLALGSTITVGSTTGQAAGTLALGTFNYRAVGAYTRTGAGTVTASTGKLVLAYGANAAFTSSTAFSIPNLEINAAAAGNIATLTTSSVTVTTAFTHTLGGIDLNALNLTVSGATYTFTAGTYAATGGGNVILTNAAMTFGGDGSPTIVNLTLNSTGTVTVTPTSATPAVARTITVSGLFTQTAGTLDLGINHVSLTLVGAAYTRAAGGFAATTGTVQFAGAGAQTFTPGTALSIPNLTIITTGGGTVTNSTPTIAFTVTGTLTLSGAAALTTNAGTLTLGDGATIVRTLTTSTLSSIPTFGTTINNTYSGAEPAAITTGNELRATVTNLTINRTAGGGVNDVVSLNKSVTVGGTLFLTAGVLDRTATPYTLTIADGATINRAAAIFVTANGGATTTNYNLTYSGGAAITSTAEEFKTTGILTLTVSTTSTVLTPHASATLGGNLVLNATSGGIALNTGTAVRSFSVAGNVTVTAGNFSTVVLTGAVTTIPTLTFNGTAAQTFTIPAAGLTLPNGADANADGDFFDIGDTPPIDFTINNTNATEAARTITLAGGNFSMGVGGNVNLTSGVVVSGSNVWTLIQGNNPVTNQPRQGYTRAVASGGFSHFVGNVKKFVNNSAGTSVDRSIVTFPVGTAPASPGYMAPLSIYFKSAPQSAINVTVNHVNSRPGGANGYPITAGAVTITNYPDFYWYVKSDISIAPSYLFDMEIQRESYTDYISDAIQNVRIVRRDSGSSANQWVLQKNNNTGSILYDNSTIAANWPVAKVIDATGGITLQGSLFSFSQNNKAPNFTAAPGNSTVSEGTTYTATFTARDPDLNDGATMSAVTLPAGATFTASTGVVSWAVGYDLATTATPTATRTITIRATDNYGPVSRDTTVTITINNVNRKPDFAATGAAKLAATSVNDGVALTFSYVAVDPDGDAVTYSGVGLPTGATVTSAGALNWTPTFLQAGASYTITVVAADAGALADTTSASVTVARARRKGDITGDGSVSAFDASAALSHSVGITVLTDTVAIWAGDVSGNGQVTAYDASLILQFVAGIITTFPSNGAVTGDDAAGLSKSTSTGSILWGEPQTNAEVVTFPVKLADAVGVTSMQFTLKVDQSAASIEGISANLPEDWTMLYKVSNGELTVAMAGVTPLASGDVGVVSFKMKSREARLNIRGEGFVNENTSSALAVAEVAMIPTEFALQQNYPNPFNPSTTIKYQIPQDHQVNLVIYNLQGQKIRTLVAEQQKAGFYSVQWDGRNDVGQNVATGMYLYRVQAGSFVASHKMLLIK